MPKLKLGKAFSDNVILERVRRRGNPGLLLRGWGGRITLLHTVLLISFFALAIRLFHLTVVQGNENRNLSEENRTRSITLHAPRGRILDRQGKPFTNNIAAFRVTGPCQKKESCTIKTVPVDDWKKTGQPINSVFLEKDFLRQYTYPYEAAHVVGYLGEISEEEINNPLYVYQNYLIGDRIGRQGLEAVFEKKLRGVDGHELIEVDSQNNRIRMLGKIDPVPGTDITLSLDTGLQMAAYEALGENPGAVVVSKPNTGEILALVSTPSFNPNKFHTGMSSDEYAQLLKSSDKPLFDRAVSGVYPPGSTFKIVSAAAGLSSGIITRNTIIEDTGVLKVGDFSFANWFFTQYGKTEGPVDIIKAIARSNDIYFYKLGETVGIVRLAQWGKKFGIGQKTGVELINEAEGLMPDPDYKQEVKNEDWYLGDSYHVAIGQGDLQTTPLQVNRWTNVIASSGNLCSFSILKASSAKPKCENLGLKKEVLATIAEGMRRACHKGDDATYSGTGYPLFDFSVAHEEFAGDAGKNITRRVPIACKTGTAEIGDPENKTHAWFTAFAPLPNQKGENTISGDPEIVVTVLVEKGGEGSTVAAPIAKKVLEEWFKR